MADLNPDIADGLPAGRDFLEFMAGAPDWEALVSQHAGTASTAPGDPLPYPVLWAGSRPSLYVSEAQFLRHVSLEAGSALTRYWLLRQFHEQACRKNHGVFLIPEVDVEIATQVSGAQHLQVHGATRLKGRRFNLLSGLTPAEAAKVLLAVLPPAETGRGTDYARESGFFSLLLIFKAQQAAGEGFALDRMIQLLSEVEPLLALSVKASGAGYAGLSQYLSSFPSDPGPRLHAQVGALAGRLFNLNSQLHSGQWFHSKGEALAPYLASSLTSVCLGPDKLGEGLAELQRVWLEFIGVLMVRRQASAVKRSFICGWPLITKQTQAILAGLLPVTQGTGNVFLFGAEAAPEPSPRREAGTLKPLVATRLTKLAGDDWEISQNI